MTKLKLRKEAEADISNAYAWYEEKREGLGSHFILCIEEAFARISRNPKQYPEALNPIRRAFIKRFPYAIYFIERETSITIIAVLHHRQKPSTLRKRT